MSNLKGSIIMEKISINAMAKINLGLDVLRRRENGYHDVKMIMQTVNIYDTLDFVKKGVYFHIWFLLFHQIQGL